MHVLDSLHNTTFSLLVDFSANANYLKEFKIILSEGAEKKKTLFLVWQLFLFNM
jgi:hypothetical protein